MSILNLALGLFVFLAACAHPGAVAAPCTPPSAAEPPAVLVSIVTRSAAAQAVVRDFEKSPQMGAVLTHLETQARDTVRHMQAGNVCAEPTPSGRSEVSLWVAGQLPEEAVLSCTAAFQAAQSAFLDAVVQEMSLRLPPSQRPPAGDILMRARITLTAGSAP